MKYFQYTSPSEEPAPDPNRSADLTTFFEPAIRELLTEHRAEIIAGANAVPTNLVRYTHRFEITRKFGFDVGPVDLNFIWNKEAGRFEPAAFFRSKEGNYNYALIPEELR